MSHKDVTIYDIARVLNISAATVSRGLKDHPAIRKETKKRILNAAQEMGYQQNTFARNLRNKTTRTIGVIVPRLNSYFMSTVIAGIEKVATAAGYNLIISQSLESSKKEMVNIGTMFNSRIDGILVSLASDTEDNYQFDIFPKKNIPLIFFDRVFDYPNCTNIVIDNLKAGYDATMHLLEQGCKRIVHVGGSQSRNVYLDRFKGYKKALEENNITQDDILFIPSSLTEQSGLEAASIILKMDPLPDGIFTANDTTAVTIIGELLRKGIRIPEDIAVVGFNNDPIANVVEPKLSTINYPGREMGEVAASTLINTIQKLPGNDLDTIVLRHNLIVRKSSTRNSTVL